MDNPSLVCRFKGFRNLARDRKGFVEWERPASETVGERFALDEFHHQRAVRARVLDAVDLRDVWMVQRRQRLRFASEPRNTIDVGCKRFGQDLDGDVTIEADVARA